MKAGTVVLLVLPSANHGWWPWPMHKAYLLPLLVAFPVLAAADTLSCPAALVCREGVCETATGDEGARLVSEAGWLGLSSDGPPVEVTAQDLDGGVTQYESLDRGEMIAVRSGDLAFDYRRRTPRGVLQLKGNCVE